MKPPIQWTFDLQDAITIRETILQAIASGRAMVNYRRALRQACYDLHELVFAFQLNGLDEEYETHYLCLFDALSHFTQALRFPGPNIMLLRMCALQLDRLQHIKTAD